MSFGGFGVSIVGVKIVREGEKQTNTTVDES